MLCCFVLFVTKVSLFSVLLPFLGNSKKLFLFFNTRFLDPELVEKGNLNVKRPVSYATVCLALHTLFANARAYAFPKFDILLNRMVF